jgi:DNA-directed RNA polymerase specialized sigma24 family protein
MREFQEYSIEETARMMGISVSAVKGRLFHAKVALRKVAYRNEVERGKKRDGTG